MKRPVLANALRLAGLLAVGLGTTCATLVRAHHALRPFPPLDCLRAALDSSPDVAEVVREFRGEHGAQGFWVRLRDSTADGGTRLADLFRDPPDRRERPEDRAVRLELSAGWPGFRRPPAAEERAVTAIAARLLTHLQASCAPDTPAAPVACDRGDGKWKSCAPAG